MQWFARTSLLVAVLLLFCGNGLSSVPPGWKKHRLSPSFFIIGAQKCGTSSLYSWIKRHPLVAAPTTKELCYFSPLRMAKVRQERYHYNGNDKHDLPIYSDQFPPRPSDIPSEDERKFSDTLERAIGTANTSFTLQNSMTTFEACPGYSQSPQSAADVKVVFPDAKAIFMVRNPADRIASAYKHGFHNDWFSGQIRNSTENVMDASYFMFKLLPTVSPSYAGLYSSFASVADRVLHEFPGMELLDVCNISRVSENYRTFCRRSVAIDVCGENKWKRNSCQALAKLLREEMAVELNPEFVSGQEMASGMHHIILQTNYRLAYAVWENVYGRENVKVGISEDMYANPFKVLNEMFEFVGLPPLQQEWLGTLKAVNTALDHVGGTRGVRIGEPRPLDVFHRVVLFYTFEQESRKFMQMLGYSDLPAAWTKAAINDLPQATS